MKSPILAAALVAFAIPFANAKTIVSGGDFVTFPHGKTPKGATSFRIECTDDVLVATIDCLDPEAAKLHASTGEGFRHSDCVELFLSPDGNVQNYYQFLIPARGSERMALFFAEKGGIQPDPYDPEWEGTAENTPEGWRATFKIPLSSFYMTRNDAWSSTWLVNIARNSRNLGEQSAWKKTIRSFHDPDRFAKVGGFPKRSSDDDVFIESASCAITSLENGEFRGIMKVRASAAVGGDYEFSSTASASITTAVKPSGITWSVPCRFPATGRNRTRLSLKRISQGRIYTRFYPVAVSYEPLKIKLTTPAYRNNFYPGDETVKIEGNAQSLAGGQIALTLTGDGIAEKKLVLDGSGSFSFDIKEFKRGELMLRAKCAQAEKKIRIRKVEPNGRRMAWVRNGALVMDGKPLYRCGMGAEGYKGGKAFAKRYFADNTLGLDRDFCRGARLEPSRLVKGIEQREAKKDVRPSKEVFDAIDRVIDSLKDQDYAWYYLCDEPEMRAVSEVYLQHLYEHICERDPYHVVRLASRDPARFVNCADWFEAHPYLDPYTDGEGKRRYNIPMNKFGAYISAIDDLHLPDKVIGTLPTCFSYKFNNPASDYPTLDEYWCSTWAAAIRGAKSSQPFFYADMGDRVWLYEGTAYLFHSYHALSDLLLFAKRTTLSRTATNDAVLYTLPDEQMFIAVNFLNEKQKVRLELPREAVFGEFRGERKWGGGSTLVEMNPHEVVIATTKPRDGGLASQKEFREYAAKKEYERLHRDNQLLGRDADITVVSSSPMKRLFNTPFKLYDGIRDVYAWSTEGMTNKDKRYIELTISKRQIRFNTMKLYGSNLIDTAVKARIMRQWVALPAKVTETGEFSATLDFASETKASRIRLEFPQDGDVELYEIELPHLEGATEEAQTLSAPQTPESDIGWSMPCLSIDTTQNAMSKTALTFDPEFPWVEFRLDEAKHRENPKWKYHAWEVKAASPGAPWAGKIAGDITSWMKGLYVQHLPIETKQKGSFLTYGYNYNIQYGFFRMVKKPAYSLEAKGPDGKTILTPGDTISIVLHLPEPCEDVACEILKTAAGGAKPWKLNGEPSVRLEPTDNSLRTWTATIELKEFENAKPRSLRVRCTLFGASLDIPVITILPYEFISEQKK